MQENDAEIATAAPEHIDVRPKPPPRADPCKDADAPDVLLDAAVKVEEIKLEVEELRAHVAMVAELANLLKLSVGAVVALNRVSLLIKDVEADAHLEVSLTEVRRILEAALRTISEHPEIVECEFDPSDPLVNTLGEVDGVLPELVGEEAVTQLTMGVDEAAGGATGPDGQVEDTGTHTEEPAADQAAADTSETAESRATWRARLLTPRS